MTKIASFQSPLEIQILNTATRWGGKWKTKRISAIQKMFSTRAHEQDVNNDEYRKTF